jgi:hypothetical protein
MKRKIFIGLALLTLLVLLNCETQPSGYQETSPKFYSHYLPLNLDNHWKYNVYVDGRLEPTGQLYMSVDGYRSSTDYDFWYLLVNPPQFWGSGRNYVQCWNDRSYLGGQFLISDTLPLGQNSETGFFSGYEMNFCGYCDMTVDCGSFSNVMKFYYYHSESTPDEGWYTEWIEYYAYDVGLIKSFSTYYHADRWGSSTSYWNAELSEYRINPR